MKHTPHQNRIALDTNIFRHRDFIAYLTIHNSEFDIYLPTIVQIETGYYYILRGFTWEDFQNDISKFNAISIEWNSKNIPKLLKFVKKNKSTLPFKHHFRDFMIGTECEALKLDLITNNSKHFQWIPSITIYTSEQFIQKLID
ncbi:type II toxin-antitoxin system VapC family toxin [Candidatus Harpocratesius sp.]